jgi:uncharacterized protein with LGFP repeats
MFKHLKSWLGGNPGTRNAARVSRPKYRACLEVECLEARLLMATNVTQLPRLDLAHPNATPSDPTQMASEVSKALYAKYGPDAATLGSILSVGKTTMYGVHNGLAVQVAVPQYLQCQEGIVSYSGYLYAVPQVAEAYGVTYDRWLSLGGLQGDLGAPVQDTTALADGQYTRFKHGLVTWSPETDAHVLVTLKDLWRDQDFYDVHTGQTLPATFGILGFPTTDETDTADGRAQFCEFENGTGIHLNGGNAVEIHGSLRDLWLSEGGFDSPLGLPVTSVLSTPDGTGQYTLLENGALCFTADHGAHVILPGAILDLWEGNVDTLGVATSDGAQSPNDWGLRYQDFQTGLVFTSRSFADRGLPQEQLYVAQKIDGPIWQKWEGLGGIDSDLGAPLVGVTTTANGLGSYADFEGGSIYCTAANGAHVLRGAVNDRYHALGAENSDLGFPVSDTVATRDGRGLWAQFDGGDIFSSPDTGTYEIQAVIWDKWAEYNWDLGALGCPTTDTIVNADGSRYNDFQHGTIVWSPWHGAHELHGDLWDKWNSLGRPSFLGNPSTDVYVTFKQTGRFVNFDNGAIFTNGTGAHEVHGDIYARWASMGYELGALGYPTSDEIDAPGGDAISYFQGGEIDRVQGVVVARVGFARNNQFNFKNFPFDTSIPQIEDAFGDQTWYAVPNPIDPFGDGIHIPTPATVTFYAFTIKTVNGKGGCFGMALASLDLYHHPEWINGDNGLADGALPTTFNLAPSGNLVNLIEKDHLYQFSAEVINYLLDWKTGNHTSAGVHQQLSNLLGAYDPPIISLQESLGDGHALVATGLEPNPGAGPNDYFIDVYDPNRPGERGGLNRIHVNAHNQWSYTMDDGSVWSGGFGNLMILPYGVVTASHTLPTSLEGLSGIVFGDIGATAAKPQLGLPADVVCLNPQPLPRQAKSDVQAMDRLALAFADEAAVPDARRLPPEVSHDALTDDNLLLVFGGGDVLGNP